MAIAIVSLGDHDLVAINIVFIINLSKLMYVAFIHTLILMI